VINLKEDTENDIDNNPQLLAKLANESVQEAIKEHHGNGRSVFYAENGNLIEHFPDGRKVVVKELEKKERFNLRKYMEG
jgi:hypothetical protein